MTTTETFLRVKKNQMATLSLMVHHEVQNYEDHKVSFKKDPKPYVYQEMTTISSTIYVTVYQKISANINYW